MPDILCIVSKENIVEHCPLGVLKALNNMNNAAARINRLLFAQHVFVFGTSYINSFNHFVRKSLDQGCFDFAGIMFKLYPVTLTLYLCLLCCSSVPSLQV